MILTKYKDGTMKLRIEDSDNYALVAKHGVDIWLSKDQLDTIRREMFV